MFYRIEHIGQPGKVGPRIIYDSAGKPVNLQPGTAKTADLDEGNLKVLNRRKDPFLRITGGSPDDDPSSYRRPRPTHATEARLTDKGDGKSETDDTPRSLIDLYESEQIKYAEFVARAKVLVGDAWPSKTPKKTEVYDLLVALEDKED